MMKDVALQLPDKIGKWLDLSISDQNLIRDEMICLLAHPWPDASLGLMMPLFIETSDGLAISPQMRDILGLKTHTDLISFEFSIKPEDEIAKADGSELSESFYFSDYLMSFLNNNAPLYLLNCKNPGTTEIRVKINTLHPLNLYKFLFHLNLSNATENFPAHYTELLSMITEAKWCGSGPVKTVYLPSTTEDTLREPRVSGRYVKNVTLRTVGNHTRDLVHPEQVVQNFINGGQGTLETRHIDLRRLWRHYVEAFGYALSHPSSLHLFQYQTYIKRGGPAPRPTNIAQNKSTTKASACVIL